LAITLLSGIATGRGMQLPADIGFRDATGSDIDIIRPMREFSREDVENYNSFHDFGFGFSRPSFSPDPFSSIERLTESFVVGLQKDFPATIPTIFRTGDKLQGRKGG
jgi:cytoplasmic tRNA 2-thiolation protein 2